MASEAELLALADRCEAASGPVEAVGLNGDILRALGWSSDAIAVYDPAGERRSGIPSYTLSVDDAAKLVPVGWGWLVSQPNAKALASGLLKERTPVMGEVQYGCDHRYAVAAATPALALCAAALRARAATMGGSDD